ncbi:MAG TPA: (Fe-S)-binding protein, partial [Thermomicrobiaceae bacterium]|nr:(Fe-S)-binding protein [Thermomicrobiaceae bacterium]
MGAGLASLTDPLALVETRPVFLGIGLIGRLLFYLAATLSIAAFGYGWWRRIAKYRRGRPSGRGAVMWQGLFSRPASGVRTRGDRYGVATIAAGSSVGRRYRATGVAHFFILWGFVLLFLGTVILTIDVDVLRNVSRWLFGHEDSFFHGPFYLGYKFVLNTFGLLAVVALAYLMFRRGVARPRQLDYARAEQPESGYSRLKLVVGDWIFVGLFMLILLTGFAIETLRIVEEGFPAFEKWSWVGYPTGRLLQAWGLGQRQAADAHVVVWWVHAVLALLFVAYIPYSKAMHIILDGVNLLAHDRSATPNLPEPAPADHAGYATIADFTWKELLDLDSCTKCGRCHEVCPARAAGAPLSPRDVILDLRQWVDTQSNGLTLFDREQRPTATGPLMAGTDGVIAGGVISDRTLWSCTTCMACVEICPVGIEHVPTIVQMRRALVDAGTMDATLQSALQNLATQGNSFGKSARMRARWTRTLDFTIADARKEKVRYLWFVGDYASFDDRLQENSRL